MTSIPNMVAVFGNGAEAASIVLRSVLKLKEHEAPVVILDYTGRGALILGKDNQMGLTRHPVLWFNTADRRRPVALFQLRNSERFRRIFLRVLQDMRRISEISLGEDTLHWAAEVAYTLSRSGTVGLGALIRSLSASETRRWFIDTQKVPEDFVALLKMLRWSMGFPSVYGISEGENKACLEAALNKKGVVWIEVPVEPLENREYALISCMIDAAVEQAVGIALQNDHYNGRQRGKMTIVHLFPHGNMGSIVPEWVRETSAAVKHVGVHCLQHDRPLNPLQDSWMRQASALWVTGRLSPLKKVVHETWLSREDIETVNNLGAGNVWIRHNGSGKAMTAKVRIITENIAVSHIFRSRSAKGRKATSVRQASSALDAIAEAGGEGCDLYRKLCDRELLRLGWIKVQQARKNSQGVDGVTIAAFRDNLEDELTQLAHELETGSYRCGPLRRVQIPKPDGGKRDIGIATIRDRVVQISCLTLMEPVFEPTFSRFSFAFRPRRSAHQALALARSQVATTDCPWVVIADIRKCFDSIDHDLLINLISRRIVDRDLLNLIQHWLEIDVLEFDELLPVIVGVPQGESLSPLLSNIYLDPLDKHFEQLGIQFVRYADDIVIITRTENEATKALEVMRGFLADRLRLELKPTKTNYVPLSEGFSFLGFTIDADGIKIKRERLDDVQYLLTDSVRLLGAPDSTLRQRTDCLTRINAIIRGWRNYFALINEPAIAEQLRIADGALEQMATYYLPTTIRDDPAWICRERFCVPGLPEDYETERETLEREDRSAGAYLNSSASGEPMQLMIKGSSSNLRVKHGRSKKVVEESAVDDVTSQPEKITMREGIVEHNSRLYVMTHGVYLTAGEGEIVIRKQKEELYRQSLKNLCLVFLQGFGITTSVDLQLRLAEADIPVVLAPAVGVPMAVLNPVVTSKSFLRSLQVIRRDDVDVVSAGLRMIASKMGNQAAVLQYFSKYRKKTCPELGFQLTKTAEHIRSLATNVLALDSALPTVRTSAMGLEGHAASLYWRQLMRLIPEELGFCRRVTQGAKDQVNQCLNYVYGMLYGEVWRAVMKAGLDPYFGLIHGSKRDQGSLVFDLIEEFRAPFADRLIMGMLGRGFLPAIDEHGTLKTRSRRQLALGFLKGWSKKVSWRSRRLEPTAILTEQTRSVARLFNREGEYHPYKMRW